MIPANSSVLGPDVSFIRYSMDVRCCSNIKFNGTAISFVHNHNQFSQSQPVFYRPAPVGAINGTIWTTQVPERGGISQSYRDEGTGVMACDRKQSELKWALTSHAMEVACLPMDQSSAGLSGRLRVMDQSTAGCVVWIRTASSMVGVAGSSTSRV